MKTVDMIVEAYHDIMYLLTRNGKNSLYGREVPSVCPNKLSLYLILQTYTLEVLRYAGNEMKA